MTKTIRLTAAQAMIKYLSVQKNEEGDALIPGMWAIFGHGNVAGMGEALAEADLDKSFLTYRAHNEQGMGNAAVAFAKAKNRKQAMSVTSSIGPGATNMVTSCAIAHANRLPVLFVPGDVFANREPDPVLQQIESFDDGTISANDCFKPVARYFDRISRPEHLLTALPRAMRTLTDPADCGPVVLAFCQDTQAEAYDYPAHFFEEKIWYRRRPQPDTRELANAVELIKSAKKPLIVAGGGVLYSDAMDALKDFAEQHQIAVCETQAGRSSMDWKHPLNFGSIGVTGGSAANALAAEADLVIGIGTRFQDFTTGSWAVFGNPDRTMLSINVTPYDGIKKGTVPLVADARVALQQLSSALGDYQASAPDAQLRIDWIAAIDAATEAPAQDVLPTDSHVIGAVQRSLDDNGVVLCAAGGLPGELQKLWKASKPNSYHMEYGYSCMGYEIAGGLGAKMALPERDVVVIVGDGSYMMLNSELATSVMYGHKVIVVLLDNRGYACINRLQVECGGRMFNNLIDDAPNLVRPSEIDFVKHAASQGAIAEKVADITALEAAIARARQSDRSHVILIDTDPMPATEAGGFWWDVAVPEVSSRQEVRDARKQYDLRVSTRRSVN